MYGKFKKTLKEKCPICGANLQIRVRYEKGLKKGVEIEIPIEYIACSNRSCYYREELEQKRRR